jgi:ABC-2 type transport system ATP-binding protein
MINDYLHKLNTNGTTIIYTSHHMDEAERMCDSIGIIDHGELIVQGTPSELLTANPDCASLEDIFLKLTGKQLRD